MSRLVQSTPLACRTEQHVKDSGLLACDTASQGKGFPTFYRHDTIIFKD